MQRTLLAVLFSALIVSGLLDPSPLGADGGPENVVVVVNQDDLNSLSIANHYIQLRNIPAENVVYLSGIPTERICTYAEFKDKIATPLFEAIAERRLADHIDFITYSTGFPTAVRCKPLLEALESKTRLPNKSAFNAIGSITAFTTFWLYVRTDDPSVMLLDANWYMSRVSGNPLEQPFVELDQSRYLRGVEAIQSRSYAEAIRVLSDLVERHPQQVAARYQLARALTGAGRNDEAIAALRQAVRDGWEHAAFTRDDASLKGLADESEFEKLLRAMPNVPVELGPTRGFNSQAFWGPNGWPNGDASQGKRLILTTVLGIHGGKRGNVRLQILDQLTRSVEADGTRPDGTFYFSRVGGVRTGTRAAQFAPVMKELKQLGFGAEVTMDAAPQGRGNVLGATLGAANIDWGMSGSRFVPGALCDNLTSFGGRMEDHSKQTPLTDFLKYGAAGACGTVVEPLAIALKFPHARLHLHYARGCNLAEAFYQSIHGPYQQLIAGDPLCKPFAVLPKFTMTGLEEGAEVTDTIVLIVNPADGITLSRYDLFVDGRLASRVPAQETTLRIPVAPLGDGVHEIRIAAVAEGPLETRFSQSRSFVVNQQGHQITLESEGPMPYRLSRSVLLYVTGDAPGQIEIRQNSRTVATLEGSTGEVRIDARALGLGVSRLQAVAIDGDRQIRSAVVEVEVSSD